MQMKGTLRAFIAVSLAIALAGCATRLGRSFDENYAQQIKAGETTKAEVLGKLGRPVLRKGTKDEETWTYAYYVGPTGLFTWIQFAREDPQYGLGKQSRLVVMFAGDVVKSANFAQEIPLPNELEPLTK
jgi:outer membrane protein assembly factor BamE (lipoprotein component of BamABCDE complex)